MFKSQTSRASRLPHLATVAALVFTIAVGLMQSGPAVGPVSISTGIAAR